MNWNVNEIKKADALTVVSFTVSDGTSSVSSDTQLLPEDAQAFDAAQNITEQTVVGYVKASLGEHLVAVYEAKVAELTNAVEPQVVPLPWA